MLCRKCEKAIQVIVKKKHNLIGDDVFSSHIPLHLSLRSFYQSLLAGCFVCRWTWARIPRDRALSSYEPISLEDPATSIPSSIEEFRSKFAELANADEERTSNLHRLGGYPSRPKVASLAVLWSIRQLLFLSPGYDTSFFVSYESIARRFWYDELRRRCGMWLSLHNLTDNKLGPYELSVNFEERYPSGLELWPVAPDALKSINALYPKLKVPGASAVDATHLWRYWFKTCSEKHAVCRVTKQQVQSFRPTRLVRLLQDDQGVISTWRLDCQPSPNTANTVPYLTLSHCWGSSQPVRLTKGDLHKFQEPSPTAALPKTYQHALATTHSLGFSHIWIDSLCIIQDDEEDWKAESALMGTIYSHAACNIAASWASDGTQGCSSIGDPAAKAPTFISLKRSRRDSRAQYQIGQPLSYDHDIKQAPLNQRGWVVQERYLARRQLSFAKRQAYWECRQLVASEEFPVGLPQLPQPSKPHLEFWMGTDMRKSWVELVELYSGCGLSYKKDKLVALSGLVKKVQSITYDQYLSGLWKEDLYKQLCWKTHDYGRDKVDQTTIAREYAPTWSWAHIDGPVVYDDGYYEPIRQMLIPWIQVIESSPDKLVLRSVAVWGSIWGPSDLRPDQREWVPFVSLIGGTCSSPHTDRMCIRIYWDESLASLDSDPAKLSTVRAQRNSDLLFLGVRSEWSPSMPQFHKGLVLRKLRSSKAGGEEYVRMGSWSSLYREVSVYDELAARLGITIGDHFKPKYLDDPRTAEMIHIVTIV